MKITRIGTNTVRIDRAEVAAGDTIDVTADLGLGVGVLLGVEPDHLVFGVCLGA